MASETLKPPVYTEQQIRRYFERIRLPPESGILNVNDLEPSAALEYLGLLQRYQLVAVPFENLSLHYSPHRVILLDTEDLFEKIVGSGSRGGYCMENNYFFGTILRTLGFQLYATGGRVFLGESTGGWGHMVNIITIGEHRYMVDVGFGPNGPVQPLRLDRDETVVTNIAPASARLVWKNIAGNSDPGQRLWCYQHRIADKEQFQDEFCFSELEFLPEDFKLMNYCTSTFYKSWFTQQIVCAKMVFGDDGDHTITGTVILQAEVKHRHKGQTTVVKSFENEQDRIQALADEFGIVFSDVERTAITGMVSEIHKGRSVAL